MASDERHIANISCEGLTITAFLSVLFGLAIYPPASSGSLWILTMPGRGEYKIRPYLHDLSAINSG